MKVFIDNTGILRFKEATITALDGTSSLLSAPGTFTIYDSKGEEVLGQNWPTTLTLNEAGDYAGIIESDVVFLVNKRYTAVASFGSAPNSKAVFNVVLEPVKRTEG